ncbi:MAG: nucleoside deaminase [bacterium]|nr:nucleoside deaminase [bacterium]
MTDKDYLKLAIKKGNEVRAPYNFGAVVVRDGEVIGVDHAHVGDEFDPSAHSEVCAMRQAGKALGSWQLPGCTLYASHEPCTMCLACAAWAEIERIVFVTPASEQKEVMYEFKQPDIFTLSKGLRNPMKVEQMDLEI